MKNYLSISLLVLLVQFNVAQNTDSLLVAYHLTSEKNKIDIATQLSQAFLNDSTEIAYNYANKALSYVDQTKNNALKANAHKTMGLVYINLIKLDSAIYHLGKAIKYYKTSDLKEEAYHTQIKIFECYNELEQYDSALKAALESNKTAKELNNTELITNSYSKLAHAYFTKSEYKKVIDILLEKNKIDSINSDTSSIADNYIHISANKRRLGDYSSAIKYCQEAQNLYLVTHDSLGISDSYLTMGAIYYYNDDNENAIKYFVKAANIVEALGNERKLAGLYNNIGSVYNELEDYSMALVYFKKANAIYQKINFLYAEAIVTANIGLAYEGLNNISKAIEHTKKSHELHKRVGNTEGVINSITNLGGIYLKENNASKAREEYKKALKMALDGNYLHAQLNIYEKLVQIEETSGNYKKAFEVIKLYQSIKDSLINEESRTQLNDMQAKLDLQEHKSKIELLKKENEISTEKVKKQKLFISSVIIVSVLLFILVVIIYRALSYSRKSKALLQKQNTKIKKQRNEIGIKNKQLTDSIKYAGRVQNALFAPVQELKNYFSDYFIISNPQNIVSGDFLWHKFVKNKLYIAVADCTGHGVPGAFMSMLGNAFLNEIVDDNCSYSANEVLNLLREKVKTSLHQDNLDGNTDGMDISLCIVDKTLKQIEFAGAYNPLYRVRNSELTEIKGDKMPISISRKEKPFTKHLIPFETGDIFFLSSDGFYDQFGGAGYMKITRRKFRELIIRNSSRSLNEQAKILYEFFAEWKADNEQTDDMMVLGFKL